MYDPSAALAFTAELGWHLLPSAEVVALVEAYGPDPDRPCRSSSALPRAARVDELVVPFQEPPAVLPDLPDLGAWLDRVNAHLAAQQGYGVAS